MTAGFVPFCISRLAVALAAMARIRGEAEEYKAVPVPAGHLVGDGAEGTEDPAVILETGGEDFDQHRLAFEAAPEQSSRGREPSVMAQCDGRVYRAGRLRMSPGAESGLPGDRESMLARFLGQTTLGAGLQFPGELPAQIEGVRDRRILAKQQSMNSLQSRNAHADYALNGYVCNRGSVFVHGVNTMNALSGAVSKQEGANSGIPAQRRG